MEVGRKVGSKVQPAGFFSTSQTMECGYGYKYGTKGKSTKTKPENIGAREKKKKKLVWGFLWDVVEFQSTGIYEPAIEQKNILTETSASRLEG